MKRFVRIGATLLLIGSAAIFLIGWILGRPAQMPVGSPPTNLDARPVAFQSDSGAKVHGWWCPMKNASCAVLLLPGIRANRLSMIGRARFLRNAGYSVLLIDFQATGETGGEHITFGWTESRDVIAAVDFIQHTGQANRVAIIANSLGGAAALLAAPPLKVQGIVLEAVYPTIEIATRNRMENYLGAMGRTLAPLLLSQLKPRLGITPLQLRPIDHIAAVECPVLILSGEKDRNTRPADTRMLFDEAREPKALWFVPNAGHIDLHGAAPREYEARVLAFLQQLTQSRQNSTSQQQRIESRRQLAPYFDSLDRNQVVDRLRGKQETKIMSKICLSVLAGALVLGMMSAAETQKQPEAGTTAPDFSLTSNDGSHVSLKDFKGKWVVLYFYPKDFTSGCTLEAQNFQRDLAKYQNSSAIILGVSVDSAQSHKEFCTKEGLNFKLLSDPDGKISAQYGSIMDYKGAKIAARNTFLINPEGKIAKVYTGVKPADHSEQVLKDLNELKKS